MTLQEISAIITREAQIAVTHDSVGRQYTHIINPEAIAEQLLSALASRLEERGHEGAWRDISSARIPENENLILIWDEEFEAPEVWAGTTFYAALKPNAPPSMSHLTQAARKVKRWMPAPGRPGPHPANPPAPPEGTSE